MDEAAERERMIAEVVASAQQRYGPEVPEAAVVAILRALEAVWWAGYARGCAAAHDGEPSMPREE